jgi:hypothetical protein
MRLRDDPDWLHGGPTAADRLAADEADTQRRAAESRARQDRQIAQVAVDRLLREALGDGQEGEADVPDECTPMSG